MTRIAFRSFLTAALLLAVVGPALADTQEWPRRIDTRDTTIVVYQPQLEKFENDILSARSAVSVQRATDSEPVFGAVWFEAQAETDRETRNVSLRNVRVLQSKFPDANKEQEKQFNQLFNREVSGWNLDMSLDQMLAMLDDNNRANIEVTDLKNDPPTVIYRKHPALLVLIDGEPKLQPIEKSKVLRVINSPMYIVYESSLKSYYLKIGDEWFASAKARGDWRTVNQPPSTVLEAAAGEDFPPVPPEIQESLAKKPEIIVSYEPAELIVSDGEPQYALIEESGLLYMSNSDSDVFMEVGSQQYYVVLSGRWFRARALDGPWQYVPADQLPQVFAEIPAGSPKEHVLAHIPDTVQAKEAILDATIPQTEKVERDRSIEVTYDGPPEFVVIDGTTMAYAANTPYAVLRADGRYYACHDAVWYVAGDPYGPWRVAITVPQVIYTIPPSNPLYYVRYVYVYSYTPDIVYVGYTPGYLGTYVYYGTVVYGTGYYYRPWFRTYYYPRPLTWGFHVNYNPWYGWTFGVGLHGHYGNLWFSFGDGWWGPVSHRHHYYNDINVNINHNTVIKRPGNIYRPVKKEQWQQSWQERARQSRELRVKAKERDRVIVEKERRQGNDGYGRTEVRKEDRLERRQGNAGYNQTENRREDRQERRGQVETRDRNREKSSRNDVYTDRKGNVYRRTDQGWEKREQKQWKADKQLQRPDNGKMREKNLEREYRERERGYERSQQLDRPRFDGLFKDKEKQRGGFDKPDNKGRRF